MIARFRHALLATTALMPFGLGSVAANPLGAQVVGGAATVAGQGTSTVTVTQSTGRAIINWQTFNIGSGETTRFVQPDSSSVTLNRVTGGLGPSAIDGTLTANGRVFLVNPDGILFGAGARINTGSFVATTNDIRNADFMAGRYQFNIPGRPNASIVNLGTITAQNGGFAALVAPGVRNTGTITANLGTVALAAGNAFSLDFYGDRLITLGVNDSIAANVIDVATGRPLNTLIKNEGKLKANGGRVELTATAARRVVDSVINNRGVIEANSIGNKNGTIVLGAATSKTKPAGAPTQTVKLSGTISVAGRRTNTKGGTVVVSGEDIQLASATIDASGQAGGGKVLIGGDVGGGKGNSAVANPNVALEAFRVTTASTVSVEAASVIDASAKTAGDGGKVVIWSDQATTFHGTINARGGSRSGNGGFVETSGHQSLTFDGAIDASASHGKNGTLLLDPQDVLISNNAGLGIVTVSSIQAALLNGDVVVTTGSTGNDAGNITVAAGISWANANTLTLSAYKDINVNENIVSSGGAAVNLRADNTGTGIGTVRFEGGKFISTSGVVSIFYNPSVNSAGRIVNGLSYVNPTEDYRGNVRFGGTLAAYMLVNSVYDLQNIQNNLVGNYALGKDIDASATVDWNGGSGFVPIGRPHNNVSTGFVGQLEGGNHNIDGLTIHAAASDLEVGLFAENSGTLRNLTLTNADVRLSGTSQMPNSGANVGILVGFNKGIITHVGSAGNVVVDVSSGSGFTATVGGLVGQNTGNISQSYSASSVDASVAGLSSIYVGSFAGHNSNGIISQSYATGSVTARSTYDIYAGGFVGVNLGTVSESYATGLVSGSGAPFNGGGFLSSSPGPFTLPFVCPECITLNSYWDIQSTGQVLSYSGTGSTTLQLKTGLPNGFSSAVWDSSPTINNGYPHLRWQVASLQPGPTVLRPLAALIPVTVTVDPVTKVYGTADPTFTYHVTSGSVLPGDAFSGSPTRAPGENVGTYAISPGTLTLPANYDVTFLSSTLLIQPRPITVTANAQSRPIGAANPALTYTIGGLGLVGGDTLSGSLATTATPSSPAGTYQITQGTLANSNYAISYVGSNLTVTPAGGKANDLSAALALSLQSNSSARVNDELENADIPCNWICNVGRNIAPIFEWLTKSSQSANEATEAESVLRTVAADTLKSTITVILPDIYGSALAKSMSIYTYANFVADASIGLSQAQQNTIKNQLPAYVEEYAWHLAEKPLSQVVEEVQGSFYVPSLRGAIKQMLLIEAKKEGISIFSYD